MNKKLITGYGIGAFLIIIAAVALFAFSIAAEVSKGTDEANKSFSWLLSKTSESAAQSGFMSDGFISSMTASCRTSRMLSALVISTSSGSVFAWPDQSSSIKFDIEGKPQVTDTSLFSKVFSANLDVGNGENGTVVITAVIHVLHADAIFAASRNSFFIILALLFLTLIILLSSSPMKASLNKSPAQDREKPIEPPAPAIDHFTDVPLQSLFDDSAVSLENIRSDEEEPVFDDVPDAPPIEDMDDSAQPLEVEPVAVSLQQPEGLFSPVTGLGWEQYLSERLDAELVRAASSEQDLALVVIKISGLSRTDLVARKITEELVDVFRFRDMLFEFGSNGFAGILQNMNLDQAMKVADTLYSKIDSIFMDMGFGGQMTIGITTRTARLLPASRMIEEAVNAAKKALEEPSLPIVAFRANPEKYRDFLAEKN